MVCSLIGIFSLVVIAKWSVSRIDCMNGEVINSEIVFARKRSIVCPCM